MTKFHITATFEGEHPSELPHCLNGLAELLKVPQRLDCIEEILKEIKNDMALSREQVLAAISQSTADIKQHVTDASARVTTTVNDLTNQIAILQTKVGDPLTQEDVDALVAAQNEVITAADSIDPNSLPPTPIPPVTV